MIVAIDGPAGSGKSTTARLLAEDLGFFHLNSGLFYRGVALACLHLHSPITAADVARMLRSRPLTADFENRALVLRLAGDNVNMLLRDPPVSAMASQVATLQPVRTTLVAMQRDLGQAYGEAPGLVVEGRDIGTVVFPHAPVKIFMTASLAVRAQRRYAQLVAGGQAADRSVVESAMDERDRQDAARKHSPLRKAHDAIVLNTDHYTIAGQVAFIARRVREQTAQRVG